MENVGYIKLHRQILDSEIWGKPPEWVKVWMYLLMRVNYKEQWLPIGSIKINYDTIAGACCVTYNTVDHFIRWSKKNGMLDTQKITNSMILTIKNFREYQWTENEEKRPSNPHQDQRRSSGDRVESKSATAKATEETTLEEGSDQTEATAKAIEKRHVGDTKATTYNNKEGKEGKKVKNIITLEAEQSSEIVAYGNPEINNLLTALKNSVGGSDFKESRQMQGRYAKHLLNLGKKIGKEEFAFRLREILQDDFKAKNCNKIAYLYGEMKSFIHSPMVWPKKVEKKVY